MTFIITIVALVIVLSGLFAFWMYHRRQRWAMSRVKEDDEALDQPWRHEGILGNNEVEGGSVMLGMGRTMMTPPPAYEDFRGGKH